MKRHLFIAIGAFCGSIARYAISAAGTGAVAAVFPLQTLLINVTGSLLLAMLLTAAFELWEFDSDIRFGLATGLLGAFTTFSAFCKETTELLHAGNYGTALLYLTLSVAFGLFAIWLGTSLVRRAVSRKEQEGV